MSVKRAFFGIFQKLTLFCCAMFFGFANAFSANLPTGYTELEYIESTGTQWIDTGVSGAATWNITAQSESFTTTGNKVLVARGSNGPTWFGAVKDTGNFGAGATASSSVSYTTKADMVINFASDSISGTINGEGFNRTGSATAFNNNYELFGFDGNYLFIGKLFVAKAYQNNTLVRNLIPAKNSSGVVGLYDTVNNRFYTNAGTGEFTPGPVVQASLPNEYQEIVPFDTILYPQTLTGWKQRVVTGADNLVNYGSDLGLFYLEGFDNKVGAPVPGVVSNNFKSVKTSGWAKNDDKYFETRFQMSGDTVSSHRLYFRLNTSYTTLTSAQTYFNEHPTTVLYLPETPTDNTYVAAKRISDNTVGYYCVSGTNRGDFVQAYGMTGSVAMKIATTAYNAARFNSVQTDLNNAVAAIRQIVTKTINQTAAIASLQADKQTRPEDACPAGKKCLLVETEENGVVVPHWFPIVENICGVPSGYTCLDYIQASGTQYIDTGIVPTLTSGAHVRAKFLALKSSDNIIFGATDSTAFAGGSPFSIDVFTNRVLMPFGGGANNSVNYSPTISQTMTTNVLYDFKLNYLNDKKASVNDTQVTYSNPVSMTSRSLLLFNLNTSAGGMSQYAATQSQIFSAVITNGSNIVFNGVPAKRDSDGVIGVYDTVSDRFLTNAGTGTFTAGPEI